MVQISPLIVALKTVSLLLGGAITYFAYRAYRRTRAPALRALAIGFGVVTVGGMAAGILDRVLAVDPSYAIAVDSALTALGFAILVYSLYVE